MRKIIIQALKISGFIALGILLLYIAFREVALHELMDIIRNANFFWVGLSLVFLSISFLSRARRWVLLIQPLNYKPTFRNTFYSLMVGYLANFALPRLGEVTRCVTLGKKEKIPVDSLFGTVIIERICDLIVLGIILVVLFISWLDKFGDFFSEQLFIPLRKNIIQTFGGTLFFWLMIAVLIVLLAALIYAFRKRLLTIKLIQKLWGYVRGIVDGLKTVYKMKNKWEFIFHSVFIWFCYIMMTWVLVFSINETSHLGFIDGVFLMVVGGIAFIAPVSGGFGAYHWMVSRALSYVYGLSLAEGGAWAILTHESNSLFTILVGAVSFAIIVTGKKKKEKVYA